MVYGLDYYFIAKKEMLHSIHSFIRAKGCISGDVFLLGYINEEDGTLTYTYDLAPYSLIEALSCIGTVISRAELSTAA